MFHPIMRQVKPFCPAMENHRAQNSHQTICITGQSGDVSGISIIHTKQFGRHHRQMPGRLIDIVIEFSLICRRLIGKVKFTRSYQVFQITRIKPPGLDHDRERFNNFMLADFTLLNLSKGVTPPLQPDMAQHSVANHFARFRYFLIKGIKREKAFTFVRTCEKRT